MQPSTSEVTNNTLSVERAREIDGVGFGEQRGVEAARRLHEDHLCAFFGTLHSRDDVPHLQGEPEPLDLLGGCDRERQRVGADDVDVELSGRGERVRVLRIEGAVWPLCAGLDRLRDRDLEARRTKRAHQSGRQPCLADSRIRSANYKTKSAPMTRGALKS